MGTTSEKLTYLNTTKTLIKEELNLGGANITTEPFRQYKAKLEGIYKDFLANGTDTLWNNWEKVSGSGETLSLTPTIKGKMKIDLKGNTSQYSTTGKQLFDKTQNYIYTNTVGTWTITQLDTGLRLKTSHVSSGNPFVAYLIKDLTNLVGKTVRFKTNFEVNGNRKARYIMGLCNSDGSNRTQKATTDVANTTVSFTIPELIGSQTYLYIGFYSDVITGSTANDYIDFTDIIATINNSNMDYEPYTGGIASPNPDYPQDIHVVSGDNSIKVEGKNLFDKDNANILTANLSTPTILSSSNAKFFYIPIKSNTTYTISKIASKRFRVATTIDIPTVGVSTNQYIDTIDNNTTYTITTNSTAKYLCVYYFLNHTDTLTEQEILDTIQIEYGNQATSYTPYVSQTYPISLGAIELCKIGDYQDFIRKGTGKNLYDGLTTTGSYVNATGEINTSTITSMCRNTNPIPTIPSESYVFSINGTALTETIRVFYYKKDHTFINSETTSNGKFTTPSNCYYVNWHSTALKTDYPSGLPNSMIEKGSQVTLYEPYEYKDKWYLYKTINKIVLNGSEDWTYGSNTQALYTNLTDYKQEEEITCKCNYYIAQENVTTAYDILDKRVCLRISTTPYLYIKDSTFNNASDFQTWLSTHNTTVYYVLATPTYTEITDNTLIGQLNALEGANSYDNQTNVSQVNNDLPFILDLTALKEM